MTRDQVGYRLANLVLRIATPKYRDTVQALIVRGMAAVDTPEAVRLTDRERERMLWWLHKPVPPGPMKELDEAIIRKLNVR